MLNKKILLVAFAVIFIVATLSDISGFCSINGYIYNATGSRTLADSINVTCLKSGSNETYVLTNPPDALPADGYTHPFGGVFDTCDTYCPNGGYTVASNSTLVASGNYTNTSYDSTHIKVDITMLGAPGPTVTIVTPTSDYTYTTGTTNYDATCVAGDGSVDEVIFISNHSGVQTNYSYLNAEVSNPSGNTYRYTMPSLSAGTYLVYEWFCNQTTGGLFDVDGPQAINVTQSTASCDVLFNESTGLTYPNSFRVWSNCDSTAVLYRNGSVVGNNSEQALGAGTYNFSVIRTDQVNYSNVYDEEEFEIQQATGVVYAYVNNTRANITIENGSSIWLNGSLQAGEPSGTVYLYKNGTFVAQNSVLVSNYSLFDSPGLYNISAIYYGSDNYSADMETWWVNVTSDTNPPYFTTTPANASINYGASLNVDFDAVDAEGHFDSFSVNDSRFNISASTGTLTNATSLGVGVYVMNVSINDTSGNYNWTVYQVTVNALTTSCAVFFNESSPLSYPYSFRVYTNCTSAYVLYRNGSVIGNDSEQALGAGTYNFTVIRNDNQNYTSFYDERNFVIQQATPVLNYYLNDFTDNVSITYPETLNASASVDIGTLAIYRNSSDVTVENNVAMNLSAGYYKYEFNVTGNENYSSVSQTLYANVNQFVTVLDIVITPSNTVTYPTFTSATATGCPPAIACSFYRNDTGMITDPDNVTLGAGVYNYTINTSGNENYSAASYSENLIINQNTSNCDVFFNTTSPKTYPYVFLVYTNCSSAYSLYRNGTPISNDSLQELSAGTYNFTVVRTDGNNNYTNNYDEENFTISQFTPTLNYYLNGATNNASVTYPATINASASADYGTIGIYRNSSDVFSENDLDISLAAGYYEYEFNVTGNENYSDIVSQFLYATVNQATGEVYCYLNASRSNLTIEIGEYADLNATINVPATGDVLLYFNDTLINQGANTIFNLSQFNSIGVYNVTAFYDGNENYTGAFETWYLNVSDSSAPQFTSINNISVYHNESVYQDIDATDSSPLCFYVNDTVNFNIDCDGILQNATTLSIGMHWIEILVNDSSGNSNISIIFVNITQYPDNNPPYFTTTPTNASLSYGQSLNVDFDAVDDEGNFDSFSVNDTKFNIGASTGTLVNATSLGVGTYILNVSINDTSGNYNWTLYQVDVSASATPCDVYFNETSPLSYPYSFEVYSDCDSAFVLYRNGSIVGNNSEQALGAGTYNFTVIRQDQANYTNTYDEEEFVIDKAIPSMSYYLNGVFDNASVTYPATVNASAFVTAGSIGIFRNSTNVTSENNADVSLGVGYYEYEFNSTGNENYTSLGSRFLYATVNQGTGVVYAYINNSGSNLTIQNGTSVNLSAVLNNGSGSIKLYINDTLINQGTGTIYNNTLFDDAGLYNISAIYEGNDNYSADIETWWLNVSEIPDTEAPVFTDIDNINVYLNNPVYYDINASDSSGIDCFGVNDTNFVIDCDGILQNATSLIIGVYWLNITVNDSLGNENSTVIYVNVTVAPTPPSGGGGGGGTPEEEIFPFEVIPDAFVMDIVQGEEDSFTFVITNKLNEPLQITVDYGDLANFISINSNDVVFTLQAGESNYIDADVFVPLDTIPDSYLGKIVVRGAGESKDVDVIINVKQTLEEALFDIVTRMVTRRVTPGTDAIANIDLTNLGNARNVEVTLYYSIIDFENNTITNAQENLIVDSNIVVKRKLSLPETETDVNYAFYARVDYPGGSATSADTFTTSPLPNWLLFLIALILIIISTIVVMVLYQRNVFAVGAD